MNYWNHIDNNLINLSNDIFIYIIISNGSGRSFDKTKFVESFKHINIFLYYHELHYLYNLLANVDLNYTSININSKILFIYKCLQYKKSNLFFLFHSSPDCYNGKLFLNKRTTDIIFKLLNILSNYDTSVEFTDKALSALIINWNEEIIKIKCPIEIIDNNIDGLQIITIYKKNITNIKHPIFNFIYDIIDDDKITIKFYNYRNTISYKIVNDDIKKLTILDNLDQSIHTFFKLNNMSLYFSSIMWSNFIEFQNLINYEKLNNYLSLSSNKNDINNINIDYSNEIIQFNKKLHNNKYLQQINKFYELENEYKYNHISIVKKLKNDKLNDYKIIKLLIFN